ncbi:uncharacterized protein LAESUDRAFT_751737 [Laetiporus sulphureus 93-53]|uniref:Extracellular membrane protein CFEM domain-containing protein n=1 Tax=Laetiporus sulphureus 93-53 TaxID=1314785 RepID=A0A165CRW6_9APHY|nr:uncharacterized protein LAESUDRAFT_751737 [Laetiporus sulphureus 93-53]KZT03327.1 hypothetical protein LAESUDRAFT_751737 [Laetiporus sulphureus 93-53]
MLSFVYTIFLLFTVLASRVLALNITVGGTVGIVPASEFLTVNDTYLTTTCQSQCTSAQTAITSCGTSNSCLCNSTTVTLITSCEQCMFDALIAEDLPMPDPRAGSATALTAYSAACLSDANVTVPTTEIALTLPSDWDGPFGLHLGIPATIFTLVAATTIGSGAIWVICTM